MFHHVALVFSDGGEGLEIVVDNLLGFGAGDPQPGREPEGRDAVQDPEIGCLGVAALVGRHLLGCLVVDFCRRDGMDILAVQEGVDHDRVVGEVRHQSQLDLRVVGRQEQTSGIGYEGTAYAAALFLAYRNVLQVGRRRRQSSRGRHVLVIVGMHLARDRIDVLWERLQIGCQQLLESPVLHNLGHDGMLGYQLFQYVF